MGMDMRGLVLLIGALIAEPAMAQPEQVLSAAIVPSQLESVDPTMPSLGADESADVKITVKTDHIRIYSISANRGNCKVYSVYAINGTITQNTFPFSLNFGEQLTADMVCNPIEIEAQTDHGVITIALNR